MAGNERNHDGFTIEPFREGDLPRCLELINSGFEGLFKEMLGHVPPGRREGERLRLRHRRPGAHLLTVRDAAGAVQGAMYLQESGTRSAPGPMAIDPTWRSKGGARALLDRGVAIALERGCPAMDSVTFPQALTHFRMYWKYGLPLFTAVFLDRPLGARPAPRVASGIRVERYSALPEAARRAALEGTRAITRAFYAGYDHGADVLHAEAARLGDTLLAFEGERLVGFAVCHFRAGGEAFADDQLFLKLLYVHPLAVRGEAVFHALVEHAEELGAQEGLKDIGGMASSGRRATVDALVERGYKPSQLHAQMFWRPDVSPQQAQEIGAISFRADQFALADWR